MGEIVVQQVVMLQVCCGRGCSTTNCCATDCSAKNCCGRSCSTKSQPIALEQQYMPYPGTQGQKIEPRSGKQGPCLEEGPVLGPIVGAGSGVSFRIGKSPSMQKFRVRLYEKT